MGVLWESLATAVTTIWLLSCVGMQVGAQGGALRESLVAYAVVPLVAFLGAAGD